MDPQRGMLSIDCGLYRSTYLDKIHNPARNVLKKAIAYHKLVEEPGLQRPHTHVRRREGYGILGIRRGVHPCWTSWMNCCDREVEHTSYRAGSFSFTALPVNFPGQFVLSATERCGLSTKPCSLVPRACRSKPRAPSGGVLKVFVPTLRNDLTHEEQQWQDEERGRVLDLFEARITAGNLSLPLVWRINRLLKDTAKRERQTPALRQRAEALRTTLPALEHFDLFDIICTNEYEDGVSWHSARFYPAVAHRPGTAGLCRFATALP